jgi:hypothetical protein
MNSHTRPDTAIRRDAVPCAVWQLAVSLCLLWNLGCHSPAEPAKQTSTSPSSIVTPGADAPWFVDVTDQVNLQFHHENGGTGELLLPEIMGSGAALLDVDRDGDLDVLLIQSGPLKLPAGGTRPSHRLLRNDLDSQAGRSLRFTDITEASGITSVGYGMGVASGDFDNDGLVDLYITSLGPNQLLKNLGNGTFLDVTSVAGVDDPHWSSSATFFDYDRDGYLDLFVTNYVDFDLSRSPKCYAPSSARDYCGPDAYTAVHDSLFHNRGNGRFENVTETAGFLESFGAGLGVVAADFNNDGWCDLYVANDGDPNQLWINQQGSGRFTDEGLLAGVALNTQGQALAGMGVDADDLDGDGDQDLFVTNLTGESNSLYVNLGDGLFEDRTIPLGLYAPSLPFTSFGTRFLDFDHDGDLDIFAMNGAVRLQDRLVNAGDPNPLRQTSQLFRNDGREGFRDVSPEHADTIAFSGVSRGACIGDVDNDGDLDVLVTTNNGPARLFLSQAAARTHWLGLQFVDASQGQDVLQTRAAMTGANQRTLWRRVHSDGSYQSASDPRIIVGLAQDSSPRSVTAHWPDGLIEAWHALKPDRYHRLQRGTGTRVSPEPGRPKR